MSPGVVVFAIVVVISYLGWAMGMHLILSPYMPEYRSYLESL